MLRAKVFVALMLLGLAMVGPGAAYGDEVVTLNTRPGVTQSFLLLEPEVIPKDVVILFPGHAGEVTFRKTAGSYEVENNHGGLTARRPMRETLRRSGFATALVAPPSDRSQLSPQFRKSAEHAQDIQKIIAYLQERYGGKLYLHGHCLASLSVASVATRLKSDAVSGLILSSARSTGQDGAVTDFKLGAVSVPVLLVNHRDDSCPFTPYTLVERVKAFYQNSAPKVDMITVTGGDMKVAMNTRCSNGFHGFRGVETDTAQAIASWLLNKEFPALVSGAKQ